MKRTSLRKSTKKSSVRKSKRYTKDMSKIANLRKIPKSSSGKSEVISASELINFFNQKGLASLSGAIKDAQAFPSSK